MSTEATSTPSTASQVEQISSASILPGDRIRVFHIGNSGQKHPHNGKKGTVVGYTPKKLRVHLDDKVEGKRVPIIAIDREFVKFLEFEYNGTPSAEQLLRDACLIDDVKREWGGCYYTKLHVLHARRQHRKWIPSTQCEYGWDSDALDDDDDAASYYDDELSLGGPDECTAASVPFAVRGTARRAPEQRKDSK